MASAANDQDLLPDQTEGFKVGEKKTMDEYSKLGMFKAQTLHFLLPQTGFHFHILHHLFLSFLLSASTPKSEGYQSPGLVVHESFVLAGFWAQTEKYIFNFTMSSALY